MTFSDRYSSYRNRQAKDWWTITFGDPLSWLVLAVVGGSPAVTPNRLTILSFFAKIVPAGLILAGTRGSVILAAILLQVGQVLDSMDGNLSRQRREASWFGGFLDRFLDAFGLLIVAASLSWFVFVSGSAPYYLLLGPSAAACYYLITYIYWNAAYTEIKHFGKERDFRHFKNVVSVSEIPTWKYILRGQKKFFSVRQADFYFWIGLGLVLDKAHFVLWLLFLVNFRRAVDRFIKRAKFFRKLDKGEVHPG